MSQPVKKIFMGLSNIASQISAFKIGFAHHGVETFTAINRLYSVTEGDCDYAVEDRIPAIEWFRNKTVGENIRNLCRSELRNYIWQRALDECDTFMFFYHSFAPDHSDFEVLKAKGKRIVTFVCGSDVRWKPAMEQEFKSLGLFPIRYDSNYYQQHTLSGKLQYLRTMERFSDVILSDRGAMQLALRPYIQNYVPIDLLRFKNASEQRERPLVIHAPSKQSTKGTQFIIPVLEHLKSEGIAFDYRLVENMPFKEALKLYHEADILVGQLFAPVSGKQERELLACGKVVLSSMRMNYAPHMAKDCPLVDVDPTTLYERLKSIILDFPRRQQLAKLGRPYIEKYHDVRTLAGNILNLLQNKTSPHTITPTFFRDHYLPRNQSEITVCNLYTDFVRNCDWYGSAIQSGTRNGLVF